MLQLILEHNASVYEENLIATFFGSCVICYCCLEVRAIPGWIRILRFSNYDRQSSFEFHTFRSMKRKGRMEKVEIQSRMDDIFFVVREIMHGNWVHNVELSTLSERFSRKEPDWRTNKSGIQFYLNNVCRYWCFGPPHQFQCTKFLLSKTDGATESTQHRVNTT